MTGKFMHSSVRLLVTIGLLCPALRSQTAAPAGNTATRQEQASLTVNVPAGAAAPTKAPGADSNFVIGNEDVLAINVWKEPDISRVVPVRTDGKISLPLIGEIQATGKTPKQLQDDITTGLGAYLSEPEVTVIVQEIRSQRFNILGHVQRPGSYLLSPPMTVVDAIATAGGFRDFAKSTKIYVLRDDGGKKLRLPFNYKDVIRGKNDEQNIQLQPRDTIVVP